MKVIFRKPTTENFEAFTAMDTESTGWEKTGVCPNEMATTGLIVTLDARTKFGKLAASALATEPVPFNEIMILSDSVKVRDQVYFSHYVSEVLEGLNLGHYLTGYWYLGPVENDMRLLFIQNHRGQVGVVAPRKVHGEFCDHPELRSGNHGWFCPICNNGFGDLPEGYRVAAIPNTIMRSKHD